MKKLLPWFVGGFVAYMLFPEVFNSILFPKKNVDPPVDSGFDDFSEYEEINPAQLNGLPSRMNVVRKGNLLPRITRNEIV